ncbi:hypothetical protein ACFQX6_54440 [Streptosporangium lutulentum]
MALHQRYAGHARQAAYLASQLPSAAYMNKFVVVVDADVDFRSLDDVMWAVCTRTDPAEDIEIMRQTWGSRVDPLRAPGLPVQHPRRDRRVPSLEPAAGLPRVAESGRDLIDHVVRRWPDILGGSR